MKWYDLAEELTPTLNEGNIEACIQRVSDELRKLPENPFSKVLELDFTNDSLDIARSFQDHLRQFGSKFEIKALYAETNGFDINPDQWYFEIFGYSDKGTLEDLDWLSDWQTESNGGWLLTGMKELQQVYASDAFGNPDFSDASDLASLLVVLKFQRLVRNSLLSYNDVKVPVFVTSHDYDFIYEHQVND